MLNFNFKRTTKNDVTAIYEALENIGYNCEHSGDDLKIKGLKSMFCNAEATVKVENNIMKVDGRIKPAGGGLCMIAVSVILVLVFLFTEIDDFDVLLGVILSGTFGVSGLFSCLVSFFSEKKALINELANVLTSASVEERK